MTLHVSQNDGLGKLFTVRFVTTVVLDFDVKIERSLGTVDLLAILVRTDELPIDFFCGATIVFFAIRSF